MRRRFPLSLLLSLLTLTLAIAQRQNDVSSSSSSSSNNNNNNTTTRSILQDVLKEISSRQKWRNLEEIVFSKLEVRKVWIGSGNSFEVRIRFGKDRFLFVFPDEVVDSSWRRIDSDFVDVLKEADSDAVLDSVVLEGPFELRVAGDDRLSLSLPMNNSQTGLKRVLVGEGVRVEVRNAQEVSLFRSSRLGIPVSRGVFSDKEKIVPWSSWFSLCMPLPPVQIVGSASLTAYRTRNPNSYIKTSHLTDDAIQLLPEKCYNDHTYTQPRSTDPLGLKIEKLEKVLSSLGNATHKMQSLSSLNAKLKASSILRFQLELERNIGSNDTIHRKLPEWRTKPKIERVWFEVTAKLEAEKLKPVTIKKVAPFIQVETAAWNSLMSNISFTKFPPVLVPQEALTLGVKW